MRQKGVKLRVLFALTALLSGAISGSAVIAHPHVFVDAKAGFAVDQDGQLTGLRITWVYDAFTSLTLLDILDLDTDNDGVLTEADTTKIVEAQTIWPDDFEGDTYLESSTGTEIALGRPQNGEAEMTDARIEVSFELPLKNLRLYDPYFYYAYTIIDAKPVDGCDVTLTMFEPDDTSSFLQLQLSRLSREETPEQDNVGRLFSDLITLQCP